MIAEPPAALATKPENVAPSPKPEAPHPVPGNAQGDADGEIRHELLCKLPLRRGVPEVPAASRIKS